MLFSEIRRDFEVFAKYAKIGELDEIIDLMFLFKFQVILGRIFSRRPL